MQSVATGCLAIAVIILTYACHQQQKEIDKLYYNMHAVLDRQFAIMHSLSEKITSFADDLAKKTKKKSTNKKGDK